jgi:serine/threonine protein kinase
MVFKISIKPNFSSGLQHPNVVRMLGLFIDAESNKYMVMEMVSKGSLKGLLDKTKDIPIKEKLEM